MINAFQNVITITRGDDATITIDITDVMGNEYVLQSGDEAKMIVKKPSGGNLEEQAVLFEKIFDSNGATTINSSDTESLEIGTYKYGVKLTKADGKTSTIISPTDFIVEEGIA